MAIHRKREESKPGTRLLLESSEPVELPAAEVNLQGISLEREDFRAYLPELVEILQDGVTALPAPVVMSNSTFVIDGETRTFWVRFWHMEGDLTKIDRLHLISAVPRVPGLKLPSI
jgi:hypothetical protein